MPRRKLSPKRSRRAPAPAPTRLIEVTIGLIGSKGDGVAVVDGAAIFVPRTSAGDHVRVQVRGDRGTLLEVVSGGPHRAVPRCRHYERCGGCALQHVDRAYYLDWKRKLVSEALSRAGIEDAPIEEIVATPDAARRRAVFAAEVSKGRTLIGFNAAREHAVVAIPDCIILRPELRDAMPALADIAAMFRTAKLDIAATLCANGLDLDVQAPGASELAGPALQNLAAAMRAARIVRLSLNGAPVITLAAPLVAFDGTPVAPPPGAFLQATQEGEDALIGLVKDAASGARRIVDLFAGSGTFALPLAKSASVSAFDADALAIAALDQAARNAQARGEGNPVQAVVRDLFERPLQAAELNAFDAAVFDPPRAGAKAQAAELAKSRLRLVVGVSCNSQSFARDASILSQGGFKLERVVPVDQFVYTSHIELVGVFRRRT